MASIILASTSKYRQKLMHDAGFEIQCVSPDFEEKPEPGKHPLMQIADFARGKAKSVASHYPESLVIGSDQGLVNGDELLGKPGSIEAACAQLMHLRGKTVILATSLVVIYGTRLLEYQDQARLHFRGNLSDASIHRYVEADLPLDCAGSFKIESRGVRLFDAIECLDPTAIQGLPMMKLNAMLVELVPDIDL